MKVVATIEGRTASSRLPGKVLMDIAGKPMLQHVIERAKAIEAVDEVVVATTVSAGDDAIEALSVALGVPCFRGSEQDVLQRLADAATAHAADVLARITGDMPLLDPALVTAEIDFFRAGDYDYVSEIGMKNTAAWVEEPTFPLGFGAEIVRPAALRAAAREAREPRDREIPTRFVIDRPDRFRLGAFHARGQFAAARRPGLRLSVNTAGELAEVRRIFEALQPHNGLFGILDVVAFLEASPAAS